MKFATNAIKNAGRSKKRDALNNRKKKYGK